MIFWLVLFALALVASPVEATARFMTQNGSTSGTCTTSGTACRHDYLVTVLACGDTVTMLNGNYTGANNMLNFSSHSPAVSNCAGNEITFSAESDGGVFINGEFARVPFKMVSMSGWIFQGFDVGNSLISEDVMQIGQNVTHSQFKRICASNVQMTLTGTSEDVVLVWDSSNNLFEDFCAFGSSGNLIGEFGSSTTGNTYRRVWTRWEGHGEFTGFDGGPDNSDCGGPNFQIGYGAHQDSIFENVISVYQPDQVTSSNGCWDDTTPGSTAYGSVLIRDTPFSGDPGYSILGWIVYGQNTDHHHLYANGNGAWFNQAGGGDQHGGALAITVQDFFVDALSVSTQTNGPIGLTCNSGSCSGQSVNRVTSLKPSGSAASVYSNSGQYSAFTNVNECISLASCPSFYTGGTSPAGARNCFRYIGGTLTSTPLWPWPMDDRIKAALARANAAGTGGTALTGTSGSGYAAATVTSEIVSRYGSVPTACLTGSSFTPNFPVASDFPSVLVRDDFDRADTGTLGAGWTELFSDVFSISSNEALAPSSGAGFARALYSDTKVQVDHEAYATWTTLSTAGDYATMLVFGAQDLTTNNQYRVRANRSSGVNTMVEVRRVDGVGTETVIMSAVDLGIESVDGNSFGVRVSGTAISVYWKWTDGIWYRIGQFTDSNLSSLPSSGVYVGMGGVGPSSINNFGAGPFVDQPVQEPPSPPASVGAGRFGTTFPGVR